MAAADIHEATVILRELHNLMFEIFSAVNFPVNEDKVRSLPCDLAFKIPAVYLHARHCPSCSVRHRSGYTRHRNRLAKECRRIANCSQEMLDLIVRVEARAIDAIVGLTV